MLKSDLITATNKKYPTLNNTDIELLIDLFFKKIVNSLISNQNVEIRGFGTFTKKTNKAKFVRNPKTNEKLYKDENFKIHFKTGKILHKRINSL